MKTKFDSTSKDKIIKAKPIIALIFFDETKFRKPKNKLKLNIDLCQNRLMCAIQERLQ